MATDPQSEDLRRRLRSVRAGTLANFAGLDQARLEEPCEWRGAPSQLRFLLNWLAEGEDALRVRIEDALQRLGRPLNLAQRALLILGEARGRLLGMLVGVPDDLFERAPAPGDWSLRQTLGHVIATDRRYLIAVQYALERQRSGRGGPLRPPDSSLPARTGEVESAGSRDDVMARLTATRDEVVAALAAVPDEQLAAPTNWINWDLDVRFRIHRFAAHDREHTIQIRKTMQALGFSQSEPQLLLADAMASSGALEAMLAAVPDELLGAPVPGGGTSIGALIEEALMEERGL